MLKSFIILVTLFTSINQTLASGRVTEDIKSQCRQENGLTSQDSQLLKTSEELSQNKKCYIKCLFEKGGYLGIDGQIFIDNMKNDKIANGDDIRLQKIFECVEKIDKIENCEKVTELIDCFTLK